MSKKETDQDKKPGAAAHEPALPDEPNPIKAEPEETRPTTGGRFKRDPDTGELQAVTPPTQSCPSDQVAGSNNSAKEIKKR